MIPFDYGWATHLPLLTEFVLKTSGPVLELGAGHYSTPILHALCAGKRLLVTVESNPDWRAKFEQFQSADHVLTDTVPEGVEWDVVLVDSAPAESRVKYIDQLCRCSQYLIVHDYDLPGHDTPIVYFKHQRPYKWLEPHTIVLSHVSNVKSREP